MGVIVEDPAVQEVVFGQTTIIPFLGTLLVATLAYFLSQKIFSSCNK